MISVSVYEVKPIRIMKLIILSTLLCISSVIAHRSVLFDLNFRGPFAGNLCNRQLSYFQSSLDENAFWAREMRDAWGNWPAGTFSGNLFDFGNFDQCINFMHSSDSMGNIVGQHCTILIPFNRSSDKIARMTAPTRR